MSHTWETGYIVKPHSQHHSDHYWILRFEIVDDAHGEHFHRDDHTSTALCTVNIRIARDEELGKLVHKLAGRISAAPHEVRTVREGATQFWAAR